MSADASSPLPALLPRRHVLSNTSGSLAGVALSWLLARESPGAPTNDGAAAPFGLHFPAKAKRVVQIFCSGGVSHLETFDPKPELERLHGKTLEGKGENQIGRAHV